MSIFQDYAGGQTATTAVGGHYRFAAKSGLTTTISGGGAIMCFRWTDSSRYCRIRQLRVGATMNTAFGTAQTSDIALFKATGWTTAPTAGVTITQPVTLENQMGDQGLITNMASLGGNLFPTVANNIAVANTGALTTGSPTVDSNAIANDVFNIIALGSSDRVILYDISTNFDYPLTLGQNEGFVITIPTTQGATGKVVYYFSLVFAVNNTAF